MNQSIHTIDLMLHFGGPAGPGVRLHGDAHPRGIEVEDNACAVVRFRSGAMGVIESSTSCAPGLPLRIEVSGERGTAALEGDASPNGASPTSSRGTRRSWLGRRAAAWATAPAIPRPSASRGIACRSPI